MCLEKLVDVNVTEMCIDVVPNATLFKSPTYRAGLKTREFERAEIDKQLEAGIIERAQLECAALVPFIPDKDGKWRFCNDYHKLEATTVKDTYLLSTRYECIYQFRDVQHLTTINAYSDYWQKHARKQDRTRTAFECHAGTFQ